MSDETDATRRFAHDLSRLREKREVTIEKIHRHIRLPKSLIEKFEAGALFNHPSYNRVYLRSFIRAYGRALGLADEEIETHLDAALQGTYQHELADRYLSAPRSGGPSVASGAQDSESTPSESEEQSRVRSEAIGDRDTKSPDPSESSRGMSQGSGALAPVWSFFSHDAIRWKVRSSRKGSMLWTAAGVLALCGLIVAAGVWYLGDGDAAEGEVAGTDTSQVDPSAGTTNAGTATNEGRPRSVLPLDDTLHVTVVATAPVRELRVRQDDDLRRPYWIEAGSATTFPFVERIILENQLTQARLFVEGYAYPTSGQNSENRIVLHRSTVRSIVDTLRDPSEPVALEPDTVALR